MKIFSFVWMSVLCLGSVFAQDFGGGGGQMPGQSQNSGGRMPPMMGGGDTAAIAVANGSIFVVSRGKLYKFDEKSLKSLGIASLTPEREGGQGGQKDGNFKGGGPEGEGGNGMPPQGGNNGGNNGGMPSRMGGRMGGGSAGISVADGFVFVVYQGKLFKFDDKDLKPQGMTDIDPSASKDQRKN